MSDWETQIMEIILDQCASWDRGDAEAYSTHVSDGCIFTNVFGQQFVGKSAFQERHAHIFNTVFKGSRLTQVVNHLRLLHSDVAVVDTATSLELPEGPTGPARTVKTHLNQVFVRKDNGWEIASYHNVAAN